MNEIPQGRSVTIDMAHRFGMEPQNFERVLRATVVPADCSPEQFAAFLLVAKQYGLNPITREIYAFPARGGGIQPIVGIDGWIRIINDQPAMNGMEFRDRFGDDKSVPDAITCIIYRKDREHPTVVTEYMEECRRSTDPWNKWPARMLRHKAAIQAARYAFGFSGIIDPDEYERGVGAGVITARSPEPPPPPPRPGPQISPASDVELTAEEQSVIDGVIDPEQEREPLDPDKYLDDLDSVMATAKTDQNLDEIWKEHMEVAFQHLMEPDQDKAQFLFERHDARIKASIAAEQTAAKKKK
jgi:phage recombination protein Bet